MFATLGQRQPMTSTTHRRLWDLFCRLRSIFASLTWFVIAALSIILPWEGGWVKPQKPWQQTLGWDKISPTQRPADQPDWPFQIQWLGHSGFILHWADQTLLFDPNLSLNCTIIRRELPLPPSFRPEESIDLALISHAHFDHFDIPTLKSLPRLKAIAGSPNLDSFFPKSLADRVQFTGLVPFQIMSQGPLTITAVPAAHGGNRFHPIHGDSRALGYMITDGSVTLYFAGDTGIDLDFASLGDLFQPHVAILPIGAYEPRILLQPHHLNPEDAVSAAQKLRVQTVIPCHFGTFRLAFDPIDQALPRFAKAAQDVNLSWFLPLKPWENQKESLPCMANSHSR